MVIEFSPVYAGNVSLSRLVVGGGAGLGHDYEITRTIPFSSAPGLSPVTGGGRAVSAASAAFRRPEKAVETAITPAGPALTGLKPGANERAAKTVLAPGENSPKFFRALRP